MAGTVMLAVVKVKTQLDELVRHGNRTVILWMLTQRGLSTLPLDLLLPPPPRETSF